MSKALNVQLSTIACSGASDSSGAIGLSSDVDQTTVSFWVLDANGEDIQTAMANFDVNIFNANIDPSTATAASGVTCNGQPCNNNGGGGGSGLSGGAIAGIVIGVVVGVCIILIICALLCYRSQGKTTKATTNTSTYSGHHDQHYDTEHNNAHDVEMANVDEHHEEHAVSTEEETL